MEDTKSFRVIRNDGGIADYVTGKTEQEAYWQAQLDYQRSLPRLAREGFRLEECTHSERRRWQWIDWKSVYAFEADMVGTDSF